MTNQFHKLLLSELHMAVYQPGDSSRLNDQLLCEAVTLNENLQSLGFVLKPEALVQLAVSPSLHTFFADVKALVPEVKAQPMYPGFPQQVMELSEAEFRLHQMMHYFSTYGMESLFGVQVSRGWLPAYLGPARTREDTTLLDARVLDLVAEEEAPLKVLSILLARRERLTNPELELVLEAASLCTAQQMQGLTVRFKENLDLLFPKLLEEAHRDTALRTLRCICSHSGDVLRCTAGYLSRRRYHLRTSEKKLLVKLLESYSLWNFRQNLMPSNSLRERNLMILQHLDYNKYSRSAEHKEAVRALRNDELLSWQGIGEELLKSRSPKALAHWAQRPGYMLRMLNRLLSLGYSKEALLEVLLPQSSAISGTLILNALKVLDCRIEDIDREYANTREFLIQRFAHQMNFHTEAHLSYVYDQETEYCDRRYAEEELALAQTSLDRDYEFQLNQCRSRFQWELQQNSADLITKAYLQRQTSLLLSTNAKRKEAARYYLELPPKQARKTAAQMVRSVQEQLSQAQTAYTRKNSEIFKRWPHLDPLIRHIREEKGLQAESDYEILLHYYPWYCRLDTELSQLACNVRMLQEKLVQEQAKAHAWLELELRKLEIRNAEAYEAAIIQIDEEALDQQVALDREYQQTLEDAAAKRRAIPAQQEAELAKLKQHYLDQCKEADVSRRELSYRKHKDLEKLYTNYRHNLETAEEQRQILQAQKEEELEKLEKDYQKKRSKYSNIALAVEILKELLREHFRQAVTPLKGRKVFCDMGQFDLKHSSLETGSRSKDGGYIRSGIAWKIPDNAKYVRFFVYWNDPERVDIDLHAGGTTLDGKHLHVGWNADFRNGGVVHSGDITHSNAAEYIDIDLSAPIREISTNVHLFGGKRGFPEVKTCYVGMMAVDQPGQNVKLYSPKNCFFTHTLTQNIRSLFYGFVDVQNRCVRFVGQPNDYSWDSLPRMDDTFSLQDYLDCVLDGQQVQVVDHAEDADVILSMGKSLSEKGISLVDHNFFLEC